MVCQAPVPILHIIPSLPASLICHCEAQSAEAIPEQSEEPPWQSLAMTEGGHSEPFTLCHSERSEESHGAQSVLSAAISHRGNPSQ